MLSIIKELGLELNVWKYCPGQKNNYSVKGDRKAKNSICFVKIQGRVQGHYFVKDENYVKITNLLLDVDVPEGVRDMTDNEIQQLPFLTEEIFKYELNDENMQKAHEPILGIDYQPKDWRALKPYTEWDIVGYFDVETCSDENKVHKVYQLSYWFGPVGGVP